MHHCNSQHMCLDSSQKRFPKLWWQCLARCGQSNIHKKQHDCVYIVQTAIYQVRQLAPGLCQVTVCCKLHSKCSQVNTAVSDDILIHVVPKGCTACSWWAHWRARFLPGELRLGWMRSAESTTSATSWLYRSLAREQWWQLVIWFEILLHFSIFRAARCQACTSKKCVCAAHWYSHNASMMHWDSLSWLEQAKIAPKTSWLHAFELSPGLLEPVRHAGHVRMTYDSGAWQQSLGLTHSLLWFTKMVAWQRFHPRWTLLNGRHNTHGHTQDSTLFFLEAAHTSLLHLIVTCTAGRALLCLTGHVQVWQLKWLACTHAQTSSSRMTHLLLHRIRIAVWQLRHLNADSAVGVPAAALDLIDHRWLQQCILQSAWAQPQAQKVHLQVVIHSTVICST